MKFFECTLSEIVSDRLTWDDFDEPEREIKQELKRKIDSADDASNTEDYAHLCKSAYLDEQRNGAVIEPGELRKLDFYSLSFTPFARIGLAGGDPAADGIPYGAVDYDHSYEDISLLVEVMMFGICAVYIKDYSFGYIKPFGDCVYDFGEEPAPSDDSPEAFLRELLIPRIELDILNGGIDIEKELYDYYHRIPAGNNPFTKFRVNEDDFMSVQDAAKALAITEGRVKKLIANRTLDGYKIGDERALWLSRDQVQKRIDYIAEHGKPKRGKGRK